MYDANFTRWSGVTNNPIVVGTDKIKNIGKRYIKSRHKFYIGKFLK